MDELGAARRVGVHVAGHVHPLLPGAGDPIQGLGRQFAPVLPAAGLEMADLQGHVKGLGHGDHLIDGGEQLHGLLPHVDGQDSVRVLDGPQGPDQLRPGVIAFRRVPETQGYAPGPVRQRLLQPLVDGGKVLVRQPELLESGDAGPDGAAARQHQGVHRQGLFLQSAHVGAEGVHGDARKVAGHRLEIPADGLPEGPRLGRQGQSAVAVADGGDALEQVAVPIAGAEQGRVRMAVQVQKAGTDGLPAGVQGLYSLGLRQVSQGFDLPAPDAHVQPPSLGPAAVQHVSVSNDDVKHTCLFLWMISAVYRA